MNPYIAAGIRKLNTPQEIIKLIEYNYGITINQIRSQSRKREIIKAKQVLAFLLLKHGMTIANTATLINLKYESVRHCMRVVESEMQLNKDEHRKISQLLNQIENVKI